MKKLLFIMFILFNVLTLMTLPGCKKENDITGTWFITTTLLGETSTDTYTFKGTREWGTVFRQGQMLGNYLVVGGNVSFTLGYLDADNNYTVDEYNGFYDRMNFMSGSFTSTATVEGDDGQKDTSSASGTWCGESGT
jgi:hypothetical protein